MSADRIHRLTLRGEPVKITIQTNPVLRPAVIAARLTISIAPILLGVMLVSPAMQWLGFVLFFLMMMSAGLAGTAKDSGLSIAEARARLDEIEAQEIGAPPMPRK